MTMSVNFDLSFPIYAQQAYANPREANGRIVCANCHLAAKPVEVETVQAVFPDSSFAVKVTVPYPQNAEQLLGDGSKGPVGVGAVVILPEGFKLAPADRTPKDARFSNSVIPYGPEADNILVVGPVYGEANRELYFPVVSPSDDALGQKYTIYVGANRGRGQVNPNGDKTNNNLVTAPANGEITDVQRKPNGECVISLKTGSGDTLTQKVPRGIDLAVSKGQLVKVDQPLTLDPNIGGFGQSEAGIVLQKKNRLVGLFIFCVGITLAQIFLVLKKKQYERVQLWSM
uniref:Component of cytochrome b6/f complex n=1 Tax=Chromerida sp. RM11 TaxID=348535 RepID=D9IXM9_9ALVE|nr:component of cytochrome b6/f complex [Chromerida sp. RM11]ADJ66596.1 component of cytochrome b6/f complex [Chromerida sp. RM11]